ncbi:MAG: hypoxanthine phosphoribosyltransferase [Clostridiales bacterium]|jgi:hypoxanthine phosphoribosyltransferase|nr:hypoxanthine phosphoribosyltransferase [Clostridiales bacterium]
MDKDFKSVLLDEKTIRRRVSELAEEITGDYAEPDTELVVICILKGSVYFFADLTAKIKRGVNLEFMAISSYGGNSKTSGEVQVIKDLSEPISGKDVLIVEDIIDSGTTLRYLKEMLEPRKPRSIKICALLDKPSRRKTPIDGDYTGFRIEDEYVVGYGLDYAQRYRNIPYIAVLKPSVYQG